jgi:tetratricopeptide (TPR) repeat protein
VRVKKRATSATRKGSAPEAVRAGPQVPPAGVVATPRGLLIGLSAALALSTLAVYAQVAGFDFVAYDDRSYVLETPQVRAGLTVPGILWALRAFHLANWHPLTWMSHMLDVTLFGLAPGGHHVTNVVLHLATTCLLFLLLAWTTGRPWPSAFASGLFALHPLHVESVAWVAERKDVLSAFLGVATLIAYARYTRAPRTGRYLTALGLFALGLAAKPMLVTLPFALLLLDYWPLRRGRRGAGEDRGVGEGRAPGTGASPSRAPADSERTDPRAFLARLPALVSEKTPFFVLAALVCVLTVRAQAAVGAVASADRLPMDARVANAVVSYARYLLMMAWPSGLAAFYPRPPSWPAWQVLLAATAVVGATIGALLASRARPYITVGWLWYLGTLVPVIGLVQVGLQAMADRYTYLPSIGIFVAVAWGASELSARAGIPARALMAAGVLTLALCAALTWRQAGVWRNTETLFNHALEVTVDNPLALNVLGNEAAARGRLDEAIGLFSRALAITPSAATEENLGLALAMKRRFPEAIEHYRAALRLDPGRALVHTKLAEVLDHEGRIDEAILEYEEALRLDPLQPAAQNNLGACLAARGRLEEAIARYREALRQRPDYADAARNLAAAQSARGAR